MIIVNNGSITQICTKEKLASPRKKGAQIINYEVVSHRLMPGHNVIHSDDVSKLISETADFKDLVKNGVLTVLKASDENAGENPSPLNLNFTNMNATDAKKVIEGILDVNALKDVLAKEKGGKKRKSIITAIEDRIEMIMAPPKKDEEGSDDSAD